MDDVVAVVVVVLDAVVILSGRKMIRHIQSKFNMLPYYEYTEEEFSPRSYIIMCFKIWASSTSLAFLRNEIVSKMFRWIYSATVSVIFYYQQCLPGRLNIDGIQDLDVIFIEQ